MSTIKDAMGADLSGYRSEAPKSQLGQTAEFRPKMNPSIRCPLPPFNFDPDTLRQFESASAPQVRIIPLPPIASGAAAVTAKQIVALTTASVSTTIVNSTNTTNTTNTGATLAIKSAFMATGVLSAGMSDTDIVVMAKSFQLISVTADAKCEVRLYGTSVAASFDGGRAVDSPVPAEVSSNIISCVSLDTAPFTWPFQDRCGANQDAPQTANIYFTVFNTAVVDVPNINVTIAFIPLES
jgi:hypothetical protein